MMKYHTKYRIRQALPMVAGYMLMLSACTTDNTLPAGPADNEGKTPIELTVGIAGESGGTTRSVTRTVTTDNPYGQSAKAFDANTNIYMVMKSEKTTATASTRYSRTMGSVTAQATGTENAVTFADGYKRYYEDACTASARDGKLSIYAACVPGQTTALSINSSTSYNSNTWSETEITPTITWPLSGTATTQTTEFLANQDLCFSNNISNLESTENRIRFNTTTNKFTTDLASGTNPVRGGKMIFYHALTKVTFKIIKGTGFGDGENEFKFSDANKNIELVDFNTGGTFNIASGVFTSTTTTTNIEKFADTKQTGDTENYVLTAFLVPGTDLNGTDKDNLNKINFTIDHNQYHVTKGQLKDALSGKTLTDNTKPALDNNKMRPGVHYIFTMTVGKTAINQLTAAVVDWEEVSAVVTPSNARVTVSLLDAGTQKTESPATFDLFRSVTTHTAIADNDHKNYEWATGYIGTDTKISPTRDGDHYSTTWIWPDNKTFYHLRAVSPKTDDDWKVTTTESVDNITLTAAASYTDVQWGAPFWNTTGKLTYSQETGFDNEQNHGQSNESHQIYKAIGATTDVIKLVMFHMMSEVKIVLQTTDDSKKVTLIDDTDLEHKVYSRLSFSNIHPTGTVQMGNGLVTATGTAAAVEGSINDSKEWYYGFVPQNLQDVVLTITTPDDNQYKIDMKDVVASSIGATLLANPYTTSKIDRWYPNYKYTYTFTLKKTGVEKITCTLADWETVTAGDDNVQIK